MGDALLEADGWGADLELAISRMLASPLYAAQMSRDHVRETPMRFVKAFCEYFKGLQEDPVAILKRGFQCREYDEMVVVQDIQFASMCAHHLVPFFGRVHFGYLPNKRIVGLSKIPRLVDVFAHRPQVQEQLTCQVVDTFQKVVKPRGCGVVIEALHLCMAIRGVRKETAVTRTTALRGVFRKVATKAEFLNSVSREIGRLI